MLLGLATKSNPKHFRKELTTLGPATQQNPKVAGLAQLSKPKILQKEVGFGWDWSWVWLCSHIQRYIIICIINILNFIIINIENIIICVINIFL